jgi:signal transduction histidine kinase
MTLRSRILIASLLMIVLPLLIMTWLINREVGTQLSREYEARVATLKEIIQGDLTSQSQDIKSRMALLKIRLADDNRFRLGAVAGQEQESAYVKNFAEEAMMLMGLSLLEIQDPTGKIISSGHFPNAFDCPGLVGPGAFHFDDAVAHDQLSLRDLFLVQARNAEGPFLAMACVDSLYLSGKRFQLIGGMEIDSQFLERLARGDDLAVSLIYPNTVISSSNELAQRLRQGSILQDDSLRVTLPEVDYSTRKITLPFALTVTDQRQAWTAAVLLVSSPRQPLNTLLRRLGGWFTWVALAAGTGSLLLAFWFSNRISRPLAELARKTDAVDLEDLRIGFDGNRRDEVGALARVLDKMTRRLRQNVSRLREAERNATLGEMARQVNHDIKNGLVPMRNVFRHLVQEADTNPAGVGQVVKARRRVIEESISYLEGLAKNYARISSRPAQELCDLGSIVDQVVMAMSGYAGVAFNCYTAGELPGVLADPISLRRVVENIVRNGCESLGEDGGKIEIDLKSKLDDDAMGIQLVICDTGPGIAPGDLGKVFDDFYTTKRSGAGLGLSIVRRLVSDFGGTITAANRPGRGAKFTIWLPAAGQ